MEMNSPLLQLALLESLKANEITDEIDLFLPFIAVTLSSLGKLEVTPELLQNELGKSFGFKPPISAIKVFLTRARKRGLLHRENHVFIPNILKPILSQPFLENTNLPILEPTQVGKFLNHRMTVKLKNREAHFPHKDHDFFIFGSKPNLLRYGKM